MRTLDIDALKCPTPGCAGRMVVLAFLTDPRVIARVLDHIGLPSAPPALAPPRFQTDFDFDFDHPQSRELNSWDDGKPKRTADWDARPPPHRAAGAAGSPSHGAMGDADDPADLDGYEGH